MITPEVRVNIKPLPSSYSDVIPFLSLSGRLTNSPFICKYSNNIIWNEKYKLICTNIHIK